MAVLPEDSVAITKAMKSAMDLGIQISLSGISILKTKACQDLKSILLLYEDKNLAAVCRMTFYSTSVYSFLGGLSVFRMGHARRSSQRGKAIAPI